MKVTLITDASFCQETKTSGFGYWATSGRGLTQGGGSIDGPSNNPGHAELQAIFLGLLELKRQGGLRKRDQLLIHSDSEEAIYVLLNKNNKKASDENKYVAERIRLLLHNLQIKLRVRHIKGHNKGNTRRLRANLTCDYYAKKHMYEERKKTHGF